MGGVCLCITGQSVFWILHRCLLPGYCGPGLRVLSTVGRVYECVDFEQCDYPFSDWGLVWVLILFCILRGGGEREMRTKSDVLIALDWTLFHSDLWTESNSVHTKRRCAWSRSSSAQFISITCPGAEEAVILPPHICDWILTLFWFVLKILSAAVTKEKLVLCHPWCKSIITWAAPLS